MISFEESTRIFKANYIHFFLNMYIILMVTYIVCVFFVYLVKAELHFGQRITGDRDLSGGFSAEDTWPKMRSAVMNGVDDPSFVKEPVPRT